MPHTRQHNPESILQRLPWRVLWCGLLLACSAASAARPADSLLAHPPHDRGAPPDAPCTDVAGPDTVSGTDSVARVTEQRQAIACTEANAIPTTPPSPLPTPPTSYWLHFHKPR